MFDQYLAVLDIVEDMLSSVVMFAVKPVFYTGPLINKASTYRRPPVKVRGLPLTCVVCNEPFQAGRELMKHTIGVHNIKVHETNDCDYCEMDFRNTNELLAHAELDHTLDKIKEQHDKRLSCKSCLQSFNSKEELKNHLKLVHFKCKWCNFLTISTKTMKEHFLSHHPKVQPEPEAKNRQAGPQLKPNTGSGGLSRFKITVEPYNKCHTCNRLFFFENNLETHMTKVHSGKEDIVAEKEPTSVKPEKDWLKRSLPNLGEMLETIPKNLLVSKEDESKSEYEFMEIINNVKNTQCESFEVNKLTMKCRSCDFHSASNKSMEIHIDNVHNLVFYKCEECGTKLRSELKLDAHIKQNHKVKLVKEECVVRIKYKRRCQLCGDFFKKTKGLKNHVIKKHSQLKEQEQPKNKLFQHSAETSEEKDEKGVFKCTECEMNFMDNELMKSHIAKLHSEKMPLTNLKGGGGVEKEPTVIPVLVETGIYEDEDHEDNLSEDESEPEIDITNEYEYSEKDEKFTGNKAVYVQAAKAVKKLFIKKGVHPKLINGYKIDIKDPRETKHGIEADIEIRKSRMKGLALVRIWGPSTSKKGKGKITIMVSKYKHSDEKYAKELSKEVIKPLLDAHIAGSGWKEMMIKPDDKFNCIQCGKAISNRYYLKVHMTKFHPECKDCRKAFLNQNTLDTHNIKVHQETSIQIVKDVLEMESDVDGTSTEAKIRVNEEANLLRRQFQTEELFNCNICGVNISNEKELLLHNEQFHIQDNWRTNTKRDISMVKTSSINEPNPKKNMTTKDENIKDATAVVNKKVEMEQNSTEIAQNEEETEAVTKTREQKDKEETERLTKLRDNKILDKRKRNDLDEAKAKAKSKDRKKQLEKALDVKNKLKVNKKKNNKTKTKTKVVNNTTTKLHPKLKELPNSVKCLHPNSLEYCSVGDGACCLNCFAMWIELDESKGPGFGRDLNTHIAEYRTTYEPKMEFPLDVIIGGGKKIRYEDNMIERDSFFGTLVSSIEASYMWRNSVDVIALANLTNMPIEVTVFDPKTGLVEEIQNYEPFAEFPWKEKDPNKPNDIGQQKMKLINYKGLHFNLIVEKNGPIVETLNQQIETKSTEQDADDDNDEDDEDLDEDDKLNEIKRLKKKLKESDVYISTMEKDLKTAVTQMKQMKEIVELVKIENKVIKEHKDFSNKTNKDQVFKKCESCEFVCNSTNVLKEHTKTHESKSVKEPNSCPHCSFGCSSSIVLEMHMKQHQERKTQKRLLHNNRQFSCLDCHFQGYDDKELKDHKAVCTVAIQSKEQEHALQETFKCRNCENIFGSKWQLMNHRRDNHQSLRRMCIYEQEGKCSFSAKLCWYKHKEEKSTQNESKVVGDKQVVFKCFTCDDKFTNQSELMKHRKRNHPESVKSCSKYETSNCERSSENCWYIHHKKDFQSNMKNQSKV